MENYANGLGPSLSMRCVENCLDKVNFQKRTVYEPLCTDCSPGKNNVTWTLEINPFQKLKSNDYQFISKDLLPDTLYNLVLEMAVEGVQGGTTVLKSNKIIQTTIPPKGGPCTITPEEGYAVITSFIIKCPEYLDINGLSDHMTYNLYLVGINGENRSNLYSDVHQERILVQLPAGNLETEYRVNLQVDVIDKYGTTVNVTPHLAVKVHPISVHFGNGTESLLNSTYSGDGNSLENITSQGNQSGAISTLSTPTNMTNTYINQTSDNTEQRVSVHPISVHFGNGTESLLNSTYSGDGNSLENITSQGNQSGAISTLSTPTNMTNTYINQTSDNTEQRVSVHPISVYFGNVTESLYKLLNGTYSGDGDSLENITSQRNQSGAISTLSTPTNMTNTYINQTSDNTEQRVSVHPISVYFGNVTESLYKLLNGTYSGDGDSLENITSQRNQSGAISTLSTPTNMTNTYIKQTSDNTEQRVSVHPISVYFGNVTESLYKLLNGTYSGDGDSLENITSQRNQSGAISTLSTPTNMTNTYIKQTSDNTEQRVSVHPISMYFGNVTESLYKLLNGTYSGDSDSLENITSQRNQSGAISILSTVSNMINADTNQTSDNIEQRFIAREEVVSILKNIPVYTIQDVKNIASVLNSATQVTVELDEKTKSKAVAMYYDLTSTLKALAKMGTAAEVRKIASSLAEGVSKMLFASSPDPSAADKDQIRNSTTRVLEILETLLDLILGVQEVGANETSIETDQMTLIVQKLIPQQLLDANFEVIRSAYGNYTKGAFIFPNSSSLLDQLSHSSSIGLQMMLMDQNPFVWDETADKITSPVASLTLKDENKQTIKLQHLEEPVKIVLSHEVPEDQNSLLNMTIAFSKPASQDNWTMDLSKTKFPYLSFKTEENATAVIIVSPDTLNISLMFLIDDTKPTFTDILTQGNRVMPYSNWNSSGTLSTLVEYNTTSGVKRYSLGVILDVNDAITMNSVQALIDPVQQCSGEMTCHLEVNVTVRIIMFPSKCLYWGEEIEIWSSEGCKVSSESRLDELHCLCNHLTSFASSIFVLPNFIDPFADAKLFLTFFENPVVVATVVFVWLIYFTLLQWALRADRNDKSKVGVIVSTNNEPSNLYLYVVSVTTGWWQGAGTTAQVYMYLMGDKGISSIHCLTDNEKYCLQSGSQDWYLITTQSSLGELTGVTIWHDNTGSSPRWYLCQVAVKDLQMSRTWTFLYNDWLAVDRGDMLTTVATLPAVSEDEFKQKRIHHFLLKSSQDLRDGHLWVSIFCKPARSTFTRAQRLTCGLSLLLTNMLTNIMFHGIPTDDPHDQVGVSGITISLTAIVIGIESSLIMFPINLIILQLFLRVAPKPKDNTKCRRNGTMHWSKQSMLYGHCHRSKTGDMETKKEEQTQDEKNSQSSDTAESPPKPKRLPWWFLYIAWFVVLTTALVSSYFVMLYGLKYGYVKSVNWLVSFLTGFSQNAVVQQPLKVICVALVITLILKKSVIEEEYGYDEELAEDEEYLHTIQGPKRKKHPALIPPSQRLMKRIRHRLHLEWFMNMILRDIVLYVFFLTILLFMVHGHRNISQAYLTTEAIQRNFFHAASDDELKLYQINTIETFYKYLENTVIPQMTVMGADYEKKDETASFLPEFHLVGSYRLRQLRVVMDSCDKEIEQLIRFMSVPYCVPMYWIGNEDTNDYNGSWKNLLDDEAVNKVTPWIHQSAFKLNTIPFPAEHAVYSGGGYVIDMPKDLNSQLARLKDIQNSDWIDDRTRAIFIEFTLFNPNVKLFSVVMMIVEFTNIGAIFPYGQVFTANLYHYDNSFEIFVAVCEVAFLLFTVLFTFIEYTRIRKIGKKKYFEDPWNYVEIVQIALSYIIIGLFFQRMMSVKDVIKDYKESRGNKFVSFYTAISWDFFLGNFMAFLIGLVILKAFKLLKFNKRMFMLADTIVMAKGSLGSFILMTGILFMAFGHFAMICFGKDLVGYVDLGTSLVTLLNFALGVSDFAGIDAVNRVLGPLFFFSFVFLAQMCFMTFFMGIIDLAISDAKSKLEVRRNKYELLEYILRKLKENILHK